MSNHEVAVCQGTIGGCLDLVDTRILRVKAAAVRRQVGVCQARAVRSSAGGRC